MQVSFNMVRGKVKASYWCVCMPSVDLKSHKE